MNRIALVLLSSMMLDATLAPGQADAARAAVDSTRISLHDTVRVWSARMDVKGKRGVVSRIDADSLGFIAPAGFRQLPREYTGDLASVERIDLLQGRHRSLKRAAGSTVLGAVLGGVGGGLIGIALGTLTYELTKSQHENDESEWANRAFMQFFGAAIFGTAGAAGGALGGLVDGSRSHETWRRVK
jgi:hypothetical protein